MNQAPQPRPVQTGHDCTQCGADRRGAGKGQPGLCDACERAARAAKSRALRNAKRPNVSQP